MVTQSYTRVTMVTQCYTCVTMVTQSYTCVTMVTQSYTLPLCRCTVFIVCFKLTYKLIVVLLFGNACWESQHSEETQYTRYITIRVHGISARPVYRGFTVVK